MKYILFLFLFSLVACNDIKDDHYGLISGSVMSGDTILIAKFNGNSGTKQEDCEMVSQLLQEKYSRSDTCLKLKDLNISK